MCVCASVALVAFAAAITSWTESSNTPPILERHDLNGRYR